MGMPANKESSRGGVRSLEVFFQPTQGRFTGVEVLTVDYNGPRRVARRIGSIRLRLGRSDLVGLTSSEVTWVLVDALHEWLKEERSVLSAASPTIPSGRRPPAPPAGVTGAAVDPLLTDTLPGL